MCGCEYRKRRQRTRRQIQTRLVNGQMCDFIIFDYYLIIHYYFLSRLYRHTLSPPPYLYRFHSLILYLPHSITRCLSHTFLLSLSLSLSPSLSHLLISISLTHFLILSVLIPFSLPPTPPLFLLSFSVLCSLHSLLMMMMMMMMMMISLLLLLLLPILFSADTTTIIFY